VTVPVPEELYCTPEMAGIAKEIDELTIELPITDYRGSLVGTHDFIITPALKAKVKDLVFRSHTQGYTEGTADWG
jgi:hypothetical protein